MVTPRGILGGAVAAGILLAGCAIPTQQDPSAISPSRVPLGLVSPEVSSTTTTQPQPSSEVRVTIYLVGPAQQLQTVQRFVQVPAPLSSIITALLAGPDRTEAAQGITSAIPDNVDLLSVKTQGAVVTVNFNAAFEDEITGSNTELAVAQVVGTVVAQTALTTGVLFEIDGVPISVPIASGAQVPGPVYGGQVTGAS